MSDLDLSSPPVPRIPTGTSLDRRMPPRAGGRPWKRFVRTSAGRAGRTRAGRRLLEATLKDEENLAWLFWRLCDRFCAEADFDTAHPAGLDAAEGFVDLTWLFSSHALNQGLSRLRLDEASYLYRLASRLAPARVAEIGRYKGGTTLLLAAAGASVTSLDFAQDRQVAFDPGLRRSLARLGLDEQVELVVADSRTYPAPAESFDLVFLDGDCSVEGIRADWATWWPAVAPGGHCIVHLVDPAEVRWPVLAERFTPGWHVADELAAHAATAPAAPASFAHFVKPLT